MGLIDGLRYNLRGLALGLRTPRLLFLGACRLLVILAVGIAAIALAVAYCRDLTQWLWSAPASGWALWLWQLLSWLIAVLLTGIGTVVGYLLAQVLFAVLIMDAMSRVTERMVAGDGGITSAMPWIRQLGHLVRQEIPRSLLPVTLSLLLLVAGWFSILGPVVTVISPLVAAVFLAWDCTDLVPARRMRPFNERFRFLMKHVGFHLGFGLWFLVPVVNMVMLSFAPIGATLYHLDQAAGADPV